MPPPRGPAIARYRAILGTIRTRTAAGLVSAWDRLDSHNAADIAAWLRQTAPIIGAAKSATVSTSAGFNALMLDTRPPAVDARLIPSTADLRSPFTASWHALAEGRPYTEAVQVGRSVAEAVGDTFVQSTARLTGDAVAEAAEREVRWVRVAEPGACDWCTTFDGRVYTTSSAGDFGHERCHCDVVPQS